LDGIWYRLPTIASVRAWIEQTPRNFIFSPKAHRQITHIKRLALDAIPAVEAMLGRLAPLIHTSKLGPILLQLPPNFKCDETRLDAFLRTLPATHQWAVEFRHESWRNSDVEDILRGYGVAWAAVDTDDQRAERRDTARFWYIRLRRSEYNKTSLATWADLLVEARNKGKDSYLYCKHEDEGSPWRWADQLLKLTNK
jgi:uncharacterized protein YecE (DUF72 family)